MKMECHCQMTLDAFGLAVGHNSWTHQWWSCDHHGYRQWPHLLWSATTLTNLLTWVQAGSRDWRRFTLISWSHEWCQWRARGAILSQPNVEFHTVVDGVNMLQSHSVIPKQKSFINSVHLLESSTFIHERINTLSVDMLIHKYDSSIHCEIRRIGSHFYIQM